MVFASFSFASVNNTAIRELSVVIKYNIVQDDVCVMFSHVPSFFFFFFSSLPFSFFSFYLFCTVIYIYTDASFTMPSLYNIRFKDAGASSSHRRKSLWAPFGTFRLSFSFSHALYFHSFSRSLSLSLIIAYISSITFGFKSRVVIVAIKNSKW